MWISNDDDKKTKQKFWIYDPRWDRTNNFMNYKW